jgi:hypothetical protein
MGAIVPDPADRPAKGDDVSIQFTSSIAAFHRETLEHLLYFNPLQHRYFDDIKAAIEEMGLPQIVVQNGTLRIRIGAYHDSQSIFAVTRHEDHEEVAGVIVYHRDTMESLLVLHVVVDDVYALNGERARELLAFRLIDQVKKAARTIKGVKTIRIIYGRTSGKMIDLPVLKNNI